MTAALQVHLADVARPLRVACRGKRKWTAPGLLTTTDPSRVTCNNCQRVMKARERHPLRSESEA